ncbi:Hsp70 family protein [Thioflexithrix psekupsensis]|uniref:Molecular chaperone DnaK n=1 Tax=Thioflexithrix psekupsensis TaxID=1570016 RepID=A0A251XBK7_9GAMM|nr:Hsp70 family protein [Thioflexithrix psekupsensis]OUD15683.1 molecular chaperone DnaK [Thioflexithrix psekupsensis]
MSNFLVGIDLGTTQTVVAYCRLPNKEIQLFDIEQWVAAGEWAARPSLPSCRYHYATGELHETATQLPWPVSSLLAELPPAIFGEYAQYLGSQVSGRLVSSAKSWLSHAGVDRTAAILPWGHVTEISGISPLHASASYLAYIRAAWARRFPDAPLEQQTVVLTVPASFDEIARELTVMAAKLAGLPSIFLLEEPQAACYDWLARYQTQLATQLQGCRLLLVCDVGGGTTDLTLIRIDWQENTPILTRIAVGEHLMLGGDNMDLLLAHWAEQRLRPDQARALSPAQLSQLIQQCRIAKERLLAENAPDSATVTILGGGSRLVANAQRVTFTRSEVQDAVLNGFFPLAAWDELPLRRRTGLVEFGLPYAADAAISRHVSAFLRAHQRAASEALGVEQEADNPSLPDAILLNGGVFRSELTRQRLVDVLQNWRGATVRVLDNALPDLAVARGAVAYALAREGLNTSIQGGSARSYFLLVANAVDTALTPQAVCVLPKGTEAGKILHLADRQFALSVGRPVRFHLVSANDDQAYQAGEVVSVDAVDFHTLPPLVSVFSAQDKRGIKTVEIPVQLQAVLTEVGTLSLSCVSQGLNAQQWQLEFQLRSGMNEWTSRDFNRASHPRLNEAIHHIELFYGSANVNAAKFNIKNLRIELEKCLGKRTDWEVPLLRELAGVLLSVMNRRRRSEEHERIWFNLVGYCLRPGLGYPLDDWRMEQLWPLYAQGVQYATQAAVWMEWWTLWRRVAGGLPAEAQQQIAHELLPWLLPLPKSASKKQVDLLKRRGYESMMRLFAVLESINTEDKKVIGELLLSMIETGLSQDYLFWCLGRLGSRSPVHGSAHSIIAVEVVENWLIRLLKLNWKKQPNIAFTAVLLSRLTGDRARDIHESLRTQIITHLDQVNAPESWRNMVQEMTHLADSDQQQVIGESLPPGLRMLG